MSDLLSVGAPAPEFAAAASDGKTYALGEVLKNRHVALIFYPANDTPGCNRQLSAARDEIAKFEQAGVQPFGVNPASVDAHRRYVDKMNFPFPLLSDQDRHIADAYHALKPDGKGIQRTVYVVSRDGRVVLAARGAPPVEQLVAAVEAAG